MNQSAGSSLDVQSAMVEEVLEDSLPVHVASLAQARRENALEIAKLQAVLAGLQVTQTDEFLLLLQCTMVVVSDVSNYN